LKFIKSSRKAKEGKVKSAADKANKPTEETAEESCGTTSEKSEHTSVNDIMFGLLCPLWQKRARSNKKSKLVFHFNTFCRPIVEVFYYCKGALQQSKTFSLEEGQLSGGALADTEALAEAIRKNFTCERCESVLLVSSDKCFKHTLSYPKINPVKAFSLYRRDIKFSFPDSENRYKAFINAYSHRLGYIYVTQFIPLNIIVSFQKLARLLGSKLVSVDMYTDYLFRAIKSCVSGDCAYVFAKEGRGLVLNSYGGNLTAFEEFPYGDARDVVNNYLLTVSKHEFEYEKAEVSTVLVNSSLSGELEEYFGQIKNFALDLSAYPGGGARI